MTPAALNIACKCCKPQVSTYSVESDHDTDIILHPGEELTLLAGVAVHMGLKRRRTREALVADLALVLLLRVGRHLGAELAHHGLRARRRATSEEAGWPGKGA